MATEKLVPNGDVSWTGWDSGSYTLIEECKVEGVAWGNGTISATDCLSPSWSTDAVAYNAKLNSPTGGAGTYTGIVELAPTSYADGVSQAVVHLCGITSADVTIEVDILNGSSVSDTVEGSQQILAASQPVGTWGTPQTFTKSGNWSQAEWAAARLNIDAIFAEGPRQCAVHAVWIEVTQAEADGDSGGRGNFPIGKLLPLWFVGALKKNNPMSRRSIFNPRNWLK